MKKAYNLNDLGWNKQFANEYAPYREVYDMGRVAVQYKNLYKVYCEKGELLASVSGKMNYGITGLQDYPAVGDWVLLGKTGHKEDRTVIHGILTRKSKFSRKTAGRTVEEQVIAANIDTVFICMSLNRNFNLRRLERYIALAWDSGAAPVVLLTKSDLSHDLEDRIEEASAVACGVDILTVSCINGSGLPEIGGYILPGRTVAFLGSSGVGKSTIINELLGEQRQFTREVRRDDDRGRHTTTNRELLLLPSGGIVIDTPGMRELHVLDVDQGIGTAFDDVESFAAGCRFADCSHTVEPGCRVREAIEAGELSEGRFENYLKLKKEASYVERKTDVKASMEYKQLMKKMSKKIDLITGKKRR